MRILVLEDDRKVANFIATGLGQEGYAVDVLNEGTDAGVQALDLKPKEYALLEFLMRHSDSPA